MMNRLEFDTSQTGFNAVLKDWQLKAMQVVWGSPDGANSRTVNQKVNQMLNGETISRASIINFLNDMKELGVLNGDDRTGKGGHHWVYKAAMDEARFKRFIASTLLERLMRDFPVETRAALDKFG
jgi:hypothetical protein